MVSHQYKCIFIHIPKVAGTSIEKKLQLFEKPSWDSQDHRTLAEIQPLTLHDLRKPFSYVTLYNTYRKLVARKEKRVFLTQKQYESYFRFSFVRNPWGRVFSWYTNVMRDARHQTLSRIDSDCSFDKFVHEHLDTWALNPQLYWLKDREGHMPYDFIGKFENLQKDAAMVFQTLGLDPELPKLNMGSGGSYHAHYNEATKKIITETYAEEIEIFGYTFQQQKTQPVLLPSMLSWNKGRFSDYSRSHTSASSGSMK